MKKIIISGILVLLLGTAAQAAEEETVRSIPIGAERSEVYAVIGEPDSSEMGYREIYNLTNGNTALLGYNDDALDSGFIIVR